jgi:hypothetical protein
MATDVEEATARRQELAAFLEKERQKAKRTANQLGYLTESISWGSFAIGGIGTVLGLIGSKRLDIPDGNLEPIIGICAGIAGGGAFLLKRARLKTKTAIWFDFSSFLDTLLSRLRFRLPVPLTIDAVAQVAEAFEIERMKVQGRMRDADDDAEIRRPVPEHPPSTPQDRSHDGSNSEKA